MQITQLETFISVATLGSFSKVAEELFISPPAVMKQINALEKELDVTLFVRTSKGLTLTDAGKVFLSDARYMLDYYKKSVERVREASDKENQKAIRVGTSIMTPAKFILDLWQEIRIHNENIKIELIPFENNPINSREILKNLGRDIDIVGGLYDDAFLIDRSCYATHLYDKKLLIAVPLTNPLSQKSEITIDNLSGTDVMIIKKDWNKHIDEFRSALVKNGVNVIDFDMFSIDAYNQAVKANIPIITVEGWEDVHPLLKVINGAWEYSVPFGILHSPTPSKDVKRFLKTVKEIVG